MFSDISIHLKSNMTLDLRSIRALAGTIKSQTGVMQWLLKILNFMNSDRGSCKYLNEKHELIFTLKRHELPVLSHNTI
jgi:hypothetical protein